MTLAGTETAELLLVSLTATPPPGATLLKETMQESVPEPAIEPTAHARPLRAPLEFN